MDISGLVSVALKTGIQKYTLMYILPNELFEIVSYNCFNVVWLGKSIYISKVLYWKFTAIITYNWKY